MITKALIIGTVMGGFVYALIRSQQKSHEEQRLEKQAQSRWEDEGGAPASTAS